MAEILSAADLADLRSAVLDLLPDLGVVWDRTDVPDATGGTKRTFIARPDPVPCRVGQVKEAMLVAYSAGRLAQLGQIGGKAIAAVSLPALTPIDVGDVIETLGHRYTVLSLLAPTTWELIRKVIGERED